MDLLTINDRPGKYPGTFYAHQVSGLSNCDEAKGDITCDVCVVGGGFTGSSTAMHLAQRGYNVRLVEANRIGFGASGRNGGQVMSGQRRDQDYLEQVCGKARARELWDIGYQAVDLVRTLAESEHLHTQFRPGHLHADHQARFTKHSEEYAAHLQSEYNYEHVRFVPVDEIRSLVNSPAYHSGTLDTHSGHIDPLQLVLGMGRMAQLAGATLHENTRVIALEHGPKPRVKTEHATITADHVVLACNGYIGGLHDDVTRRVMPISNFIIATEPLDPEEQEKIIAGKIAVADTKFVVNYFRFSEDHRLIFGGTESYGYRYPSNISVKVHKAMTRIFPQLADKRVDFAWGGTLGITMNRLPHYATYGGNVLSMSGFSGQGVALGPLSGQIAADAIAGQTERFDVMSQLPTPRFPGGKAMQHPLLVLAMLWYSLKDKL